MSSERTAVARTVAARLGSVGVWTFDLDVLPVAEAAAVARAAEDLGFGSLWIAEGAASREALTHAAVLLGATERLVVGTGIASIWARDPVATAAGARTLADAFPDRFVLGLGVSHAGAVGRRGHVYAERPVAHMREYLDRMDAATLNSPAPPRRAARVLAALRERMTRLAADRTDGAHTYFVPVAHTRRTRAVLGQGPLLVVELAAVLDEDPESARRTARRHTAHYLARENYRRNLQSLGLGGVDGDLAAGGSDDVVDTLVAWGDDAAVRARVQEHLDAGADHVVLQPLGAGTGAEGAIAMLRRVAGAVVVDRTRP